MENDIRYLSYVLSTLPSYLIKEVPKYKESYISYIAFDVYNDFKYGKI